MDTDRRVSFDWWISAFCNVQFYQPWHCWNLLFQMLVNYWDDLPIVGSGMEQSLQMFYRYLVFAPTFECFTENSGCVYVVVLEAKKFTDVDYFVAFFWKVFSIVELLKEVRNWCWWIPTSSYAIEIGCDVVGGCGSVLSV